MPFDLDAPEPGLADVELAPGLTATIRPLTGQLDARANAEISGMTADLRSGAAAAQRFGLDAGAVSDQASLAGLPDFARQVVLGSLCIAAWDVTRKGEPVPVTERTVAEVFNAHPTILAAFRAHLYAAAAERLEAGNVYASWPSTVLGEEASTAGGCAKLNEPCSRGLPTASGQLCPFTELAPREPEAVATWRAITGHSGLWRRGGMDGQVIGLELDGVVTAALRYGATDPAAVQELAAQAEAGMLAGLEEVRKK